MVEMHYNQLKEFAEIVFPSFNSPPKELVEKFFNFTSKLERSLHLKAGPYERAGERRRGYANGYKPKRLITPAGELNLLVPKTSKHDTPFYPSTIERGKRSCEAIQKAIAECYFQGVSTRKVAEIFKHFGIESLSPDQVTAATKELDEEIEAWRNRELGKFPYLIIDARYEKLRQNGKVNSVALLIAIGIDQKGNRHILGESVAPSEAKIHWKEFLVSLTDRGLCDVEYIVSDDHAGLNAARREVFPDATWQRCQFHLTQNAKKQAPNKEIKKSIAADLRTVYNAENLEQANNALNDLVDKYSVIAPLLALWLKDNVPEALAVFSLPKKHWVKMRTSNLIERAVNQQIKQRTRNVRSFPNEESLVRLVTGLIFRIDKKWSAENSSYISW